ncbi:MAG: hypothetical protein GY821_14235 [Gammaproteobacteria bacterium]|nr:hypothetical protein [Gammaproteobacteria bacterium]
MPDNNNTETLIKKSYHLIEQFLEAYNAGTLDPAAWSEQFLNLQKVLWHYHRHGSFIEEHQEFLTEAEGLKHKTESLTKHSLESLYPKLHAHPQEYNALLCEIYYHINRLLRLCKTMELKSTLVLEEQALTLQLTKKQEKRNSAVKHIEGLHHHYQEYETIAAEQQEGVAGEEHEITFQHPVLLSSHQFHHELNKVFDEIEKLSAHIEENSHTFSEQLIQQSEIQREQLNQLLETYFSLYDEESFKQLLEYLRHSAHLSETIHYQHEAHHIEMAKVEFLHALVDQLEHRLEALAEQEQEILLKKQELQKNREKQHQEAEKSAEIIKDFIHLVNDAGHSIGTKALKQHLNTVSPGLLKA